MANNHSSQNSILLFNILIFITILFFSKTGIAASFNFIKERIEITIYPEYCELKGNYFFLKKTTMSPQIKYPFVINDKLNYPDSIVIWHKNRKPINFRQTKKAVIFTLEDHYFGSYYRQQTSSQYFEYILTSTAAWTHPLKKATYIIKLHHDLVLSDLSIPYNIAEKDDNFTTYTAFRKDYIPNKNLIIKWSDR